MPPKTVESPQHEAAVAAKADLESLLAQEDKEQQALEAGIKAVGEALSALAELRKGKGKAEPLEEELTALMDSAQEEIAKIQAAAKAAKDAARKALATAVSTATPFHGDIQGLKKALQDGDECGVPDKELADARDKLNTIISFQFQLKDGTETLVKASQGKAATLSIKKLEDALTAVKAEGGCYNTLQRIELEQWMLALTKVSATQIATDAMDEAVNLAQTIGMDEKIWKPLRKKNEDAKKAQNAKKIADRKAKKPPSDPPSPPERPAPHEDVQVLKERLVEAIEKGELLLVEAKATLAMKTASKPAQLETSLLLDLGERPVDELHPNLQTLTDCVAAAKGANVDVQLLATAEKALADAIQNRKDARTLLAASRLAEASAPEPGLCDVKVLGEAIRIAEEESVEELVVSNAKAHEFLSYRTQSENALEPLAMPQALSHEGFQIIDPLKAALDEANKREAQEDLRIKAQAKLDFWLEARTRRDNAMKAMNLSLKPAPCKVELATVEECLVEAKETRVDPQLIKDAEKKLLVARLAQRMFAKCEAPPGKLNIPELIAELADVGGEEQTIQQQRQEEAEAVVAALKDKIAAIKETKDSQKARDSLLKKQIKQRANKQKPEGKSNRLLPAWVRKEEEVEHEIVHEVADPAAVQQDADLKRLEEELTEAQAALKEQAAVVKSIVGDVYVPQDVIAFAQHKLKVSQLCDEMQLLQLPELLDVNCAGLQASILKNEQKFPDMAIAGLGEQELNVPKDEIIKAKQLLKEAQKAQARQARARTQLQVRINAPTGTATFDILVKLVAEAKAAGVEQDLILRAELKLKKMEVSAGIFRVPGHTNSAQDQAKESHHLLSILCVCSL